ncbi:hypothetical protein [Sinorhizobium meliloti]|uniref:hypothetical protein n=1 Tax=Rhizobium meliloti TaxID=382 RepID=UPI001295A827|nr:hypothetical protein [Sinorhizobium meliloti]MDW9491709.1 hypothetical protein [Sinorhizobium meliloti]MQV02975.1 hypothetical protein [Sinorhizobium meliloti]
MTTTRNRLGAGLSKLIAMGTVAEEPSPSTRPGQIIYVHGRPVAREDRNGDITFLADEEIAALRARRDELLANCNRLEQEARDARTAARRLWERLVLLA